MKQAVVIAGPPVRSWGACLVGLIHDEMQAECPEKHIAGQVGEMIAESIRRAGQALGVRCPLDGEHMAGPNWTHTH